jgi:precorrin-2/cobalt-factor-2 C20-methyltransferase
MTTGLLIGVGVGPGDPELVTLQAVRVLGAAERVFAPTTAVDAVGRAESIVREILPRVRVERLVFTMDGDGAERARSHRAAAAAIAACLGAGERVAFVTLGDPNIYSTFTPLAAEVLALRPDQDIETVAGITAFQALAARSATVLLHGTEQLALVTAADGPAAVEAALADPRRAIVVYKGGRHLPEVAKRLAAAGRLDGALVGELLGLPGERVAAVADVADAPATYLATVIVPPSTRSRPPGRVTAG